jgi:RNA polymerase sigma factor (sigma-70 family)
MANAQLHGVLHHLHSLRDAQAMTEAPDAQLVERFARGHEEAPFAALVRRHGPMVWSVSRRVLANLHDAEDVFQATFLLLARKAQAIRKAESVGSWLHGVAQRLALKVRVQQVRRQAREKRAADMRPTRPAGEPPLSEAGAVLDAALGELPERYRSALVLCYLEGNSQEEAARRLGCPLATVRTWVARGRKLLRDRLAKRGLTLSTAGLAALLLASAAPAAPAALVKAAIGAALPFAAGRSAAALCSEQAAGLIEGGLQAMFLNKLKKTALLLLVGLIATAAALAQGVIAAGKADRPPAAEGAKAPAAPARPPAAKDKDSLPYGGRVLGPDGKPVRGAKLYLTVASGYHKRPRPSPEYGTTGPDGRFTFSVPKAKFAERWTVVAATAPGYGAGWVQVKAGDRRDNLTIRLVPDDGPITGQIVDLEGKPIRGATLTVLQIHAAPGGDLGPWLEAVRGKKGLSWALEQRYLKHYTRALCPKATSDAAGRLRLNGIGRNRLVRAQLDGPGIVSGRICILTQPGKTFEVTKHEGRREYNDPRLVTTYYGATFRYVAAPSKPIVGVVRDRDTKKPLAGVTIQSYKFANDPYHGENRIGATTDAHGRYRLTGMPKGKGNLIMLVPPGDLPYLPVQVTVPDTPGLAPVTVDFALKRGVWIEGKLTDKVTGKPVSGAAVEYFSMYPNPSLADYPGFNGIGHNIIPAKEDGTYRVVGVPGPGLVGVYYHRDPYLRAPDRDDEFGVKERSLSTAPYHISFTSNYNALARVNPAKGVASVRRDVTLDPGWMFKGTVLGPDGKPLPGAQRFNLNGRRWWQRERMKTAEFTARFNPRRPYGVVFQHPEKGLVGVAQPPEEKGGAVTVRLEPGAAVTGRLVDAAGKPRTGVELEVSFRPKGWGSWFAYSPERVRTDRGGRFRVGTLLPGYEFGLADGPARLAFGPPASGKTKDLGDVQIKVSER